ncbi:hypothetical protein CEXT_558671 [Caerostris extrusa]|uniref:Uncharacterized protein n=1 Tax=Caerostris extrusa TaxID=172846 RepID=A0AAV4S4F6_CAEEX|nr:hypothetical protein CEXT_558671 [Caerostris extrusa]
MKCTLFKLANPAFHFLCNYTPTAGSPLKNMQLTFHSLHSSTLSLYLLEFVCLFGETIFLLSDVPFSTFPPPAPFEKTEKKNNKCREMSQMSKPPAYTFASGKTSL